MPGSLLLWISFLAILFTGCANESDNNDQDQGDQILLPPDEHCGDPILADVRSVDGNSCGVFEILNDSTHLWVSYAPNASIELERIYLYFGSDKKIPRDNKGNLMPLEFKHEFDHRGKKTMWVGKFPLSEFESCFTVSAYLMLRESTDNASGTGRTLRAWAVGRKLGKAGFGISYCLRDCNRSRMECQNGTAVGEFLTHTQEDWGLGGSDAEQAKFLAENFEKTFPNGLSLGCNEMLHITTVDQVVGFLPNDGAPAALKDDSDTPAGLENALAAELCALTMNLRFDEMFEARCQSPVHLASLEISTGAFKGWKVKDIEQEANVVLGACASNYSPGQMREVLATINANFRLGSVSEGFLVCPNQR
ncbi:MAG: hypothetical protein AAF570_13870 [Bacteroidota bacterium]